MAQLVWLILCRAILNSGCASRDSHSWPAAPRDPDSDLSAMSLSDFNPSWPHLVPDGCLWRRPGTAYIRSGTLCDRFASGAPG
jgi:hypothetical protein